MALWRPIEKPSQVILRGWNQTDQRQVTGTLVEFDGSGNLVGACAIGCLLLGAGVKAGKIDDGNYDHPKIISGYLDDVTAVNPETGEEDNLASVIMNLNDDAEWSIPQITNWLRDNLAL